MDKRIYSTQILAKFLYTSFTKWRISWSAMYFLERNFLYLTKFSYFTTLCKKYLELIIFNFGRGGGEFTHIYKKKKTAIKVARLQWFNHNHKEIYHINFKPLISNHLCHSNLKFLLEFFLLGLDFTIFFHQGYESE